jgi:hypothetical protein
MYQLVIDPNRGRLSSLHSVQRVLPLSSVKSPLNQVIFIVDEFYGVLVSGVFQKAHIVLPRSG